MKCAKCFHENAETATLCSRCGQHLQAARPAARRDQCSYELQGRRCQFTGTMTTNTLGDGPWLCRWHWECTSPVVGEEVILQSQQADNSKSPVDQARANYAARVDAEIPERIRKMSVAECQAEIKRLLPGIGGRAPGSDWAVRIMDRIAKGEKLPIISEQRAREALGLSAEREPGEDFGQDDAEREVAA